MNVYITSVPSGNREGVDNVAILVTNGDSDFNSAASEAEQLRDSGVLVLTVGVGSGINEELLINISTNGLENCIHVESFTELAQSPDVTLNNMCPTQSTSKYWQHMVIIIELPCLEIYITHMSTEVKLTYLFFRLPKITIFLVRTFPNWQEIDIA